MNIWLAVRLAIAIFLTTFGIGLIFVRSEDERMMIGAFFVALGGTFLSYFALALRNK